MITEDYVGFETAKLLKEKGFDEPCHALYHDGDDKIFFGLDVDSYHNAILNADCYACPTLQMAMKWLREEENFFIEIQCYGCEANEKAHFEYSYVIEEFVKYEHEFTTLGLEHIKGKSRFNSYEQACETAIKYCLENLI